MKKLKQNGKVRREIYLNLIQQKYLKAINEDETIDHPTETSPRVSINNNLFEHETI